MENPEKRIGTYNPDGSVKEYPELSLEGVRYSRPCSTRRFGVNQFVVITGSPDDDDRLIEELKASLPAPAATPKAKVKDADAS